MPWMWSWLMLQTENLMEYFGLVLVFCFGSAILWMTWFSSKVASGIAVNILAELIVLRNERRLRPSFCIGATPIYADIVCCLVEWLAILWTAQFCGRFHRGAYLF